MFHQQKKMKSRIMAIHWIFNTFFPIACRKILNPSCYSMVVFTDITSWNLSIHPNNGRDSRRKLLIFILKRITQPEAICEEHLYWVNTKNAWTIVFKDCSTVRYGYIFNNLYSKADTYQMESRKLEFDPIMIFFNNIYHHAEDQPPHIRHK